MIHAKKKKICYNSKDIRITSTKIPVIQYISQRNSVHCSLYPSLLGYRNTAGKGCSYVS